MPRRRRQERRESRQQERQTFGVRGDATRYQMREKLVSIGDDFWIENNRRERAFKVNGKALRVRQTLIFEDPSGRELARIQERKARVRETMKVEGPDGETLAQIHKAMVSPIRERFTVKLADGEDLDVQGNVVDHEYKISRDSKKVAEVSKKWFRVRDTYGVEVAPGENDIVILAVTVGIDMM